MSVSARKDMRRDVDLTINQRVHVFDIDTGRWYTQIAGGDIPSSRRGICAGVTWAADKSSYNMYVDRCQDQRHANGSRYMFGGINATEYGMGDLYVLTIPTFKWILVGQKQSNHNGKPSSPV